MANNDWLGNLTGTAKEAEARFKSDAQERREAAKIPNSIILNQKDVLTGEWDSGKVLMTTIGGDFRPITLEDLKIFKHNIEVVKSKFTKGITAKQVIDMSLKADRDLAQTEIRHATPVGFNNGKVSFLTNAGGTTKGVTRHHVIVHFTGYGAEAASGSTDSKKSASRLKKGKLLFDCDCGRHRYWFRYIATIGGYNAGRAETGFPKIRNPNLYGIACKHVLRVMAEIETSGMVQSFLARAMAKAKASDEGKAVIRQAQQDAENLVKAQAKRDDHTIKTSAEKKAIADALKSAKNTKPKTRRSSKVDRIQDKDAKKAAMLAELSALKARQSELEAALANIE